MLTGILDATGVSDKFYDGIGNYVSDSMNNDQIIIH